MKKNYFYKSIPFLLAFLISCSLYARTLNATPTPSSPVYSLQYKVVSFFAGLFQSELKIDAVQKDENLVDDLSSLSFAPTITCPSDITIECDESIDPDINLTLGKATAIPTDGTCTIDISYTDVTTAGACPNSFIITRTWTAEETCGINTASTSCNQTINVTDTTPPVLSGVPANADVDCESIPVAAIVTATDNCSAI
ncbi:hypothetical protein, partial [Aestuariivivens sediminicola]|uniref:hypothetical protein n=1 Tax=Aestuariivivens sediminicola TaxID=2913560 RepID=UPI001F59198B